MVGALLFLGLAYAQDATPTEAPPTEAPTAAGAPTNAPMPEGLKDPAQVAEEAAATAAAAAGPNAGIPELYRKATAVYDGANHWRPWGIKTDKVWKGANKWAGVAAVGKDLFFAPASADTVLAINVGGEEPKLYGLSTRGIIPSVLPTGGYATIPQGPAKWCAAAAVGTNVYFAPMLADDLLVLDTKTWVADARGTSANKTSGEGSEAYLTTVPLNQRLSKGGTEAAPAYGMPKWMGIATVGDNVILSPSYNGNVLDFNAKTKEVKTIDATGVANPSDIKKLPVGGYFEWRGEVAFKNKVYYAPFNSNHILVVDLAADTRNETKKYKREWKTGFYSGDGTYTIKVKTLAEGNGKWFGGVENNGTVYFAPYNAECILVVNPADEAAPRCINIGDLGAGGLRKWRGGASVGKHVFFAPYDSHQILILDTETDEVFGASTKLVSNSTAKWMGAAVVDKKVYFAPFRADSVLVYNTEAHPGTEPLPPPPPTSFLHKIQSAVNFRGGVETQEVKDTTDTLGVTGAYVGPADLKDPIEN